MARRFFAPASVSTMIATLGTCFSTSCRIRPRTVRCGCLISRSIQLFWIIPYAVFPNTPQPLLAAALRALDQNMKTAYTVSWDARLEREIKKTVVVAATYVGASGNRLYENNNIN